MRHQRKSAKSSLNYPRQKNLHANCFFWLGSFVICVSSFSLFCLVYSFARRHCHWLCVTGRQAPWNQVYTHINATHTPDLKMIEPNRENRSRINRVTLMRLASIIALRRACGEQSTGPKLLWTAGSRIHAGIIEWFFVWFRIPINVFGGFRKMLCLVNVTVLVYRR